MNKVKAHLAPTPSVTAKGVVDFEGRTVGFLRVERHPNRPVIVYRDGDGLSEGDILYRYAGQSSRIKFADLRAMLEERDRRAQVELAKAAGALADVGTANAIILDTDRNTLNTKPADNSRRETDRADQICKRGRIRRKVRCTGAETGG